MVISTKQRDYGRPYIAINTADTGIIGSISFFSPSESMFETHLFFSIFFFLNYNENNKAVDHIYPQVSFDNHKSIMVQFILIRLRATTASASDAVHGRR